MKLELAAVLVPQPCTPLVLRCRWRGVVVFVVYRTRGNLAGTIRDEMNSSVSPVARNNGSTQIFPPNRIILCPFPLGNDS